jgi:predicted MFS family arabinose efflux permease
MLAPAELTHFRHKLVALSFLLGLILYLDRGALSILAPAITRDLGLSPMAMGGIFSAFVAGYTLFNLPAGWLGDRLGPRRVLSAIVLLWSGLTAATGGAWDFGSILVIRFLFGTAEAGATPNVSAAFARWIPPSERARAEGFFFSGMSAGAAIAAPVVTICFFRWGWRTTFLILGAFGTVWAAGWAAWYRDQPALSLAGAKLNPGAQPRRMLPMAWHHLLRRPDVWAILLMYFTYGYTGYIYITWYPTYLIEARHISVARTGLLAALPGLLGIAAKPLGGWWSDRETLGRGVLYGRRLVGMCGFGAAGLLVLPALLIPSPVLSALLFASSDAAAALVHGVCFAVCLDIGLERAGTVSALMLTAGSLGNIGSALSFGSFLQYAGSWTPPFLVASAANLMGAFLWLKIDPRKRVV